MHFRLRNNNILAICSVIGLMLFYGPYYFENPEKATKPLGRRQLHQLYQKNIEMKYFGYVTKGTADNPISHDAVFRDGILGNYETTIPGNRSGPGENGEPVTLGMTEEETKEAMKEYGYNINVSDVISLDRTWKDTRIKECQYWHYPEDLPTTSVIIIFHNEGLSPLLRTVHSVINTSPPHLLKEIILIDDYSDKEPLKEKLEEAVTEFNGLVRLYRNDERLGLITSKTKGAQLSSAEVILFLDSHCECGKNWLPPLLTRIAKNRTTLAVPIIDGIEPQTFEYKDRVRFGYRSWGIFEWSLLYKENYVAPQEDGTYQYRSEPFRSPTHAGGLLAINRQYFFELGAYDPGLSIWGGENFELSFKIWQCGGKIEWVPCSRVGHVYRSNGKRTKERRKMLDFLINNMRVIEVWFDDEHKRNFYRTQPWLKGAPLHDLQPRLDIRRKYGCKSFQWYLDNVAYDVTSLYPAPKPNVVWGQIRPFYTGQCWSGYHPNVYLLSCKMSPYANAQFFRIDVDGRLFTGEMCVVPDEKNKALTLKKCGMEPTGHWKYDKTSHQIVNEDTGSCVQVRGIHLVFAKCDPNKSSQSWQFKKIYMWK